MREAAVGNALSPTVDSLVGGISADVDDDLSLCLELMSATRRSSSQRYSGRQVMQTAVDEDRQFVLDTLWYSQPVQVAKKGRYALDHLRFEKIRRAAAFKTDCSESHVLQVS